MKWTSELPTVEGYYWNRAKAGADPSVEYVGMFTEHYCVGGLPASRQSLHVFFGHMEYETVSSWGGEWAGPLKPPTETYDFLWHRNAETGEMEHYSTYAARRDGHTTNGV